MGEMKMLNENELEAVSGGLPTPGRVADILQEAYMRFEAMKNNPIYEEFRNTLDKCTHEFEGMVRKYSETNVLPIGWEGEMDSLLQEVALQMHGEARREAKDIILGCKRTLQSG